VETAKHAKKLPGNSLSADEGSASIAQVREAGPRVTGYNNSINKRTEFAGAPAIGGGAMTRRQVLLPGISRVASAYIKSVEKTTFLCYNIVSMKMFGFGVF
jgi:hypothetical protein